MHPSFELAQQIFGGDANFYSPYYSQITLESWRSDSLNYKQIKPAKGERDTAVTICYNSMSHPEAACTTLSPNAICINPLNWETSSNKARLNDTVTVRVDNMHNVLLVEGFHSDSYYRPWLDYLFKRRNYHIQELPFHSKNLSENIKHRFETYKTERK